METRMPPSLENPLGSTIEPDNRIAQQEPIIIGNSLFSNSSAPLPRLNAGLAREPTRGIPVLPETDHSLSSIEANFPHIAEKLTLVWGYAECFAYLSELIIDNRGNRMGFDRDIMSDLMLLLKITEHVTPDKWTHAPGNHR